jgi:uncharacterized membrane protein HdeD (DUF308 family)
MKGEKMKDFITAEKTKNVLMSICLIAFGILFIALPDTSYNVLTKVIAWALIIAGAIMVLYYFINFKLTVKGSIFVNGVLFFGLGLLLLFVPDLYITFIGIALAFAGLQTIGASLERKKRLEKIWWQELVSGLVNFAIGVVLVVLNHAKVAQNAVMIYLGISLIIDGIYILVAMLLFKKVVKEIVKVAVSEGKEENK